MEEKMITTTEVAEMFGVSGQTVRRWINDGKLDAIKTPGGKLRVKASSAEKLLNLSQTDHNIKPE